MYNIKDKYFNIFNYNFIVKNIIFNLIFLSFFIIY